MTPIVLLIGPGAENLSLSTNFAGSVQSSYDGYWECQVTLISDSANASFLTISAPQSTNVVVYPAVSVVTLGGPVQTEMTGQLGYTGTAFIFVHATPA